MQTPEQMLREFHSTAGLPLPAHPTATPELGSQTGRAKILAEEVRELADAIEAGDIIGIADASADVVYAVVGTAVTYGVPFDAVFAEVHRSNMTKLTPRVVINGDGKIVKGPGYEPPDIARVLARESANATEQVEAAPAMLRVGGRRFYCTAKDCDVGVFTKTGPDTYVCNGCGRQYKAGTLVLTNTTAASA